MIQINGIQLEKHTDEQLVTIINNTTDQELQKASFGIIIERNYKPLTSYVNKLLNYDYNTNNFEVADIVHNAVIKAYESLSQFTNNSSVLTWLCTIARNDMYNNMRDESRRPPAQDVQYEEILNSNDSMDDPNYSDIRDQVLTAFTELETPEAIYESVETMERIEDAVDELSDELQEIYALRFIEGLSYSDIADTLGLPMGTVSTRIAQLNEVIKDTIASE